MHFLVRTFVFTLLANRIELEIKELLITQRHASTSREKISVYVCILVTENVSLETCYLSANEKRYYSPTVSCMKEKKKKKKKD